MNWADRALDRSIVLGYSRIGFHARALGWPGGEPGTGALAGRTVVVTGATSGIGAAIAGRVADLGGEVVLVGRDRERAEHVRADVTGRNPTATVRIELADVSDLGQVRALAGRLAGHGVDSLVHNAGVLPPERTESADGHELSLATHVIGPVLLTELLLPRLAQSPDARVVFMSSGGMYSVELPAGDIEYRSGQYRPARAYARSKRIQTALLPIMAERWVPAGVTVAGMHPGWVDTPGIHDSLPRFSRVLGPLLRSTEQGADTAIWLLASRPAPGSGQFWHDRRRRPVHYLRRTRFSEADRDSVWHEVRAAAGLGD